MLPHPSRATCEIHSRLSLRATTERDGQKAHPNDIFLTSGASEGITLLMGAIIANPSVGVMIPIPQYPLYSATITLCDGVAVGYYLVSDVGPINALTHTLCLLLFPFFPASRLASPPGLRMRRTTGT